MTENSNNQIGYFLSKYAKILVLLALVIVISIPMIEMMSLLGIKGLFSYFSNKVTNTTGVNQYLANAIIMALMIPLLWSFKWTFSFSSQKRRTGYSIVAGYIIVFYLSMFFLTKEQKFDFSTGKATKYYANTPEGMRYFDAPGFDPKYGIPLKPVDPNVARSEAHHTRPPQKLEDPKQFFDFATKDPLVWCYEGADGAIEFYDQPGFHPRYAKELIPVTPDFVLRYEKRMKTKNMSKRTENNRNEGDSGENRILKQEMQNQQYDSSTSTTSFGNSSRPVHLPINARIGPQNRYINNNDGSVTDSITSLMWMRCAIGQTWIGGTCKGKAKQVTWEEAIKFSVKFAGYDDWRLPNIGELGTIVYCSNGNPDYFSNGKNANNDIGDWGCYGKPVTDHVRPTLANDVFPNSQSSLFWSSSHDIELPGPNGIYFGYGSVSNTNGTGFTHIRMVRYGVGILDTPK